MIQRVGKLPIPSTLRNLRRLPGGSVTLLPFPGVGFRFVTPSCVQGGRSKLPPLPRDGVALSYPTGATNCRTGAVFAICDNGAAADPLAGSPDPDGLGTLKNLNQQLSQLGTTPAHSLRPLAGPVAGFIPLGHLFPPRPCLQILRRVLPGIGESLLILQCVPLLCLAHVHLSDEAKT